MRLTRRQVCAAALTTASALAFGALASAQPAEPSPEAVLGRPQAYEPFEYARVVTWLWSKGRREQAAFWFYVFQARTRPWAEADAHGDGAAALRSAINDELGSIINAWVASDLAAWRTLAERAVAYERRLPLSPDRPPGLGAEAWRRTVETCRAEYAAQLKAAFDTLAPAAFAARRHAAGLAVGPWERPGPPLPEAWR